MSNEDGSWEIGDDEFVDPEIQDYWRKVKAIRSKPGPVGDACRRMAQIVGKDGVTPLVTVEEVFKRDDPDLIKLVLGEG